MANAPWTRRQLLVAFWLYCRLPFGQLHRRNPQIIEFAKAIGRTPSALAMKLVNIASLDPAITSTGRTGLRAASTKDHEMWAEMQQDWSAFAVETSRAVEAVVRTPQSDESAAALQRGLGGQIGRERRVTAVARIGQTFFREALLSAYRSRCCITGLATPELLIASHIVPWRSDESNRANPRNGLLLSALHDRAFDSGLITIAEDMTVCVGAYVSSQRDRFLAEAIGSYNGHAIDLPEKFWPEQRFLEFHRRKVFRG